LGDEIGRRIPADEWGGGKARPLNMLADLEEFLQAVDALDVGGDVLRQTGRPLGGVVGPATNRHADHLPIQALLDLTARGLSEDAAVVLADGKDLEALLFQPVP